MGFETSLNLLWLLISVVLLAVLELSTRHKTHGARRTGFPRRLIAVALIAVFVFPCISATDDLWTVRHLRTTVLEGAPNLPSRVSKNDDRPAWRLGHFFESLQSLTLPKAFALAGLLFFEGLVLLPRMVAAPRSVISSFGRSPPTFSAN